MAEMRTVVCLWAFDKTGGFGPQFVAAASEGLRDAFYEESERLREAAEDWFLDFGDGERERWTFEVRYARVEVPAPAVAASDEKGER